MDYLRARIPIEKKMSINTSQIPPRNFSLDNSFEVPPTQCPPGRNSPYFLNSDSFFEEIVDLIIGSEKSPTRNDQNRERENDSDPLEKSMLIHPRTTQNCQTEANKDNPDRFEQSIHEDPEINSKSASPCNSSTSSEIQDESSFASDSSQSTPNSPSQETISGPQSPVDQDFGSGSLNYSAELDLSGSIEWDE